MIKRFTLIELLVVVVIIGILASILLPSLRDARRKALTAVCLSNLSNAGKALHMYMNDNEGFFPTRGVQSDGRSKLIWFGKTGSNFSGEAPFSIKNRFLNQYLGEFEEDDEMPVAKCPEGEFRYETKGASYRANNVTMWNSLVIEWNKSANIGEVKSPSIMASMNEFAVMSVVQGQNPGSNDWAHTTQSGYRWTNLFADGRCQMLKFNSGLLNTTGYVFERDK